MSASHEIGVRMALGAQAPQVVWLFVRRGLTLLAIGLPIGLAGAAAVGLLLRGLLIQTRPIDPLTLVLITGLVCVVIIAACLIPARRAAHCDPLAVLQAGRLADGQVLKVNVYLTDIKNFEGMNRSYLNRFGRTPVRTTIAVTALPDGSLVEIDCIAHL